LRGKDRAPRGRAGVPGRGGRKRESEEGPRVLLIPRKPGVYNKTLKSGAVPRLKDNALNTCFALLYISHCVDR